jgi:hypothetical protein
MGANLASRRGRAGGNLTAGCLSLAPCEPRRNGRKRNAPLTARDLLSTYSGVSKEDRNIGASPVRGLVSGVLAAFVLVGCGDDLTTEADTAPSGPTTPQGPQATPPNVAPNAFAGPDQAGECASHSGTRVTLTSAGSSDTDGQVTLYEWFEDGRLIATGPAPTLNFALGTHTILLRVTDDDGGTNDDVVIVTIRDTRAPLVAMHISPTTVWPPNHTMHVVSRGISAADVCDPSPTVHVTVTSDEPENGLGDGDTAPDWSVQQVRVAVFDVAVRAERSGVGNGRTYAIGTTAADGSGNSTTADGAVSVPHNQ